MLSKIKKNKLIFVVLGVVIFGGALFGSHQHQYSDSLTKEQSNLIDQTIQYTFKSDTKGIISLFPETLQTRIYEDTKNTYSKDENQVIEQVGTTLNGWITTFDNQYGKDWTYDYEIENVKAYSNKELKDLKIIYKLMGVEDLKIDGAKLVKVEYHLKGLNGTTGSNTIYLSLVKSGKWYLGQNMDSIYSESIDKIHDYDIYGDLLDGFSIVNVVDADGNIVEVETGTEETEDNTEDTNQEESEESDAEN